MADGFLGLGKRSGDRVVIVSRDEWEAMQVDVRGLKRLADLEAQERREQNARFAAAIDTLEARINELGSLLASVAANLERTTTEFVNRLQRAETALAEASAARATDVSLAFDRIDELEARTTAIATAHDANAARIVGLMDAVAANTHGASGAQLAAIETELAALRGELSGRLEVHAQALESQAAINTEVARSVTELREKAEFPLIVAQNIPSLADIAAAAPAPDIEQMRAYYEEMRERAGHETSVMPERAPRIVVAEEALPEDQQKIIDKLEAALVPPVLEHEERAPQEPA